MKPIGDPRPGIDHVQPATLNRPRIQPFTLLVFNPQYPRFQPSTHNLTVRTLYLCRHAKSSWADPGQSDHERPLNERGLRDAPAMARHFKQRGEPLAHLVSSDASRAQSTARFFARELGMPAERITLERRLYHAEAETIAEVVSRLPDDAHRVMLFGHNPGISLAVEHFTGDGPGELPTCGLVRIDFVADSWKETGRGLGNFVWFEYPKRVLGTI
jgi:phosphohistidine phosphatase